MTQHHHQHGERALWNDLPAGFADGLGLEARLSDPIRGAALELAFEHLDAEPELILDLGSGTGADAVALARRFPTARVHALDVSTELLGRVGALADESGVADRVVGHRVDLDADWAGGVPAGADIVWAALSLHHLADPATALRDAFESLRPGGALILTEPAGGEELTLGALDARPALRDRVAAALNTAAHPTPDWAELLAGAGFAPADHHPFDLTVRTDTPDGAHHLQRRLRGVRERIADSLSARDLDALDTAIAGVASGASASLTSGRAVWVAVRPREDASAGRPMTTDAEVAVVGGGAAGLAAAVVLARSRRRVVVIDAGHPRNAPAAGAHNVLGNEGISPLELVATGRAEATGYGVEFVRGRVSRISGGIDDFTLDVDGAGPVRARRIILATGLIDDLPDIPGVAAGWGRSVLHCPFCHGWEVRDQRIAVLASSDAVLHQAVLFRRLSDRVTVFLNRALTPTNEQWERLAALDVEVVESKVDHLIMDGTQVRGIATEGGRTFDADAVVVAPRFTARTDLYESLGGEAEGTPFGTRIPADARGLTAVPGVWAVGNAADPMAMVVSSAASGVMAGSAVHGDLAIADLDSAVRARRSATA